MTKDHFISNIAPAIRSALELEKHITLLVGSGIFPIIFCDWEIIAIRLKNGDLRYYSCWEFEAANVTITTTRQQLTNTNRVQFPSKTMEKTTKDEFYRTIGKLDVTLELTGKYPYLCRFKYRSSRKEVGRCDPEGQYWIAN